LRCLDADRGVPLLNPGNPDTQAFGDQLLQLVF